MNSNIQFELQLELSKCHDCAAEPGQVHGFGCDVERCSFCGGQRLQCYCPEHDAEFARWTGIWPGHAEVQTLGISLNAVSGHLALLIHGKPGDRWHEPDVELINRLLPMLRECGHSVSRELSKLLHEGLKRRKS